MATAKRQADPATPAGSAGDADREWAKSFTVLLVDDQKIIRSMLRAMLHDLGISNIIEASDGHAALALLDRANGQTVDLIVSDLHMPGMDGLEFCNQIRRSEQLRQRHLPFLLLTGSRDQFVIDVVRQVGVAEIAHKPISPTQLRGHVERLVGFRLN